MQQFQLFNFEKNQRNSKICDSWIVQNLHPPKHKYLLKAFSNSEDLKTCIPDKNSITKFYMIAVLPVKESNNGNANFFYPDFVYNKNCCWDLRHIKFLRKSLWGRSIASQNNAAMKCRHWIKKYLLFFPLGTKDKYYMKYNVIVLIIIISKFWL